jgi:hypothetical protein
MEPGVTSDVEKQFVIIHFVDVFLDIDNCTKERGRVSFISYSRMVGPKRRVSEVS